jgi:hypothetical protein
LFTETSLNGAYLYYVAIMYTEFPRQWKPLLSHSKAHINKL